MTKFQKIALTMGTAAMLATTATPVFAASAFKQSSASETLDHIVQSYDGHRSRWRHRDRVDAGDILTGIGILAGIAIIAGAASDASKNDRADDRYEPRYDERDYDQPQLGDEPDYGDDDLGAAVSVCSAAAERAAGDGERVSEIRSVTRDGEAWRVEGELKNEGFSCAATNGRIDYIRLEEREI